MKNVKYVFAKVEFLLFYFPQIGYNKTAYGSYYKIVFCNTKLCLISTYEGGFLWIKNMM